MHNFLMNTILFLRPVHTLKLTGIGSVNILERIKGNHYIGYSNFGDKQNPSVRQTERRDSSSYLSSDEAEHFEGFLLTGTVLDGEW